MSCHQGTGSEVTVATGGEVVIRSPLNIRISSTVKAGSLPCQYVIGVGVHQRGAGQPNPASSTLQAMLAELHHCNLSIVGGTRGIPDMGSVLLSWPLLVPCPWTPREGWKGAKGAPDAFFTFPRLAWPPDSTGPVFVFWNILCAQCVFCLSEALLLASMVLMGSSAGLA